MLNSNTVNYPFGHQDLQINAEYDSDNQMIYLGRARPGAADSAAEWQITKFTYDSAGNITESRFADGTHDYNKVWDNRATYSY
jgi:YD repeat-containing protein